jgi:hypothetical protein
MVAQPIPVAPGLFKSYREEPPETIAFPTRVNTVTESTSVVTGSGSSVETGNARRAKADQPPVQCLLVVEDDDEKTSLTLPMRRIPIDLPDVYELATPGTVRGIKLEGSTI